MKDAIGAKKELAHTGFKIITTTKEHCIQERTYKKYKLEYVENIPQPEMLFTLNGNGFLFNDEKYNEQLKTLKEKNPQNLFEVFKLLPN